jgi:hypothetical protein
MSNLYDGKTYISKQGAELGVGWSRIWWTVNSNSWLDFCSIIPQSSEKGSLICYIDPGVSERKVIYDVDLGMDLARGWADVNGDDRPDFCRITKTAKGEDILKCSLVLGQDKLTTIESTPIDLGSRDFAEWTDVNLDGRSDFCTVVEGRQFLECTLSTGNQFGKRIRDLLVRR